MGTPGQTHTASFSLCLSTQINSHSSRALSCLKLQLLIIDHLLPERPQCGIMRIKTRAEKAEREKCKRVEQRRRADTELIPAPGQTHQNTCFVREWGYYVEWLLDFFCSWVFFKRDRHMPGWFTSWKKRRVISQWISVVTVMKLQPAIQYFTLNQRSFISVLKREMQLPAYKRNVCSLTFQVR